LSAAYFTSVRVLSERLLDCLGEVVSGGASSLRLNQESKHLLAEHAFSQLRLAGQSVRKTSPGRSASAADLEKAGPLIRRTFEAA